MNNEWLTAYVLHRRPYRETSYIVDFFTLEEGRVSAVAKGVKNSKSDKKSLLQPFQALRLQLSGKSELKNLRHVESTAPSIILPGTTLFCAMYVNELCNRIMPIGLASDLVFEAYQDALASLSEQGDVEITLRQFEFAILDEMGLLPDFTLDVEYELPVEVSRQYNFQAEAGFVVIPEDALHLKGFPGEALLDLAQGEFTPLSKRVAKVLCRDLLRPLIGDKPLKSRELFSRMAPKR
ncbi:MULTISPECIES: DNA repair protein RecO [unclassified Alteromonas]|jgi:DNA repair protein RecO (recombination protein O)|uniref:DNA repair protein RecO n=1 Tax=unclassified Alteromonas TaxID=2614992 RepID=UPI0005094D58|nr:MULTISPECIES: DNA repair protein RecO [unclassified Alteromonas]